MSLEYDMKFFSNLGIVPGKQNQIDISIHLSDENNEIHSVPGDCMAPFVLEYAVFNYGLLRPILAAHKEDRSVNMNPYVQFPGTPVRFHSS
jgi:hypothetical protein